MWSGLDGTMRLLVLIFVLGEVSSLLLGIALTYYASRAYWRSGSNALRSLTIGFGSLTAGFGLGIALFVASGDDLVLAVGVQSLFLPAGFGFLTYALYVRDNRLGRATRASASSGQVD